MKISQLFSFLFLFSLLCIGSKSFSQERFFPNEKIGFYIKGGLSLQFGSHQNRLGINVSTDLGRSFANVGLQYHLLYTFSDYGYFRRSFQHIAGLKLTGAFKNNEVNYRSFTDSPFSQEYFYQFHYLYRYYFNKWGTKQPTGEIGLNFGHFFLKHENDLLAAKSVDKFRTAAMRLGYNDSIQSVATSFIFWTGNKDHPKTKRIRSSTFSRYGYFDLSDTPLGKYSHGILAVDYERELQFGNTIRLSLGYDDERIRDLIQNKFMHDLPIWPQKWNTAKSRHVPMVDQKGNSFLYGENQVLKEGRFYWGIGLNSTDFY